MTEPLALNPTRHEEWHITVEGDVLEFVRLCEGYGVKPLVIELSNRNIQLMSATSDDPYQSGFYDAVAEKFKVLRVKYEVDRLLPGETPLYFETHVKLEGIFRYDRQGASRDVLRSAAHNANRWYLTKRTKAIAVGVGGGITVGYDPGHFANTEAPLLAKGSRVVGAESEFCLHDSNPGLDANWL